MSSVKSVVAFILSDAMKYFKTIMMIIRVLAILIILFCGYAILTEQFSLLKKLSAYFIPFIIIYFLGSLFQMLFRFKSAGRYASSPEPASPSGGSEEEK